MHSATTSRSVAFSSSMYSLNSVVIISLKYAEHTSTDVWPAFRLSTSNSSSCGKIFAHSDRTSSWKLKSVSGKTTSWMAVTYGSIISLASMIRLCTSRTALLIASIAVVLIDSCTLPMPCVSTVARSTPFSIWYSGPETTCFIEKPTSVLAIFSRYGTMMLRKCSCCGRSQYWKISAAQSSRQFSRSSPICVFSIS